MSIQLWPMSIYAQCSSGHLPTPSASLFYPIGKCCAKNATTTCQHWHSPTSHFVLQYPPTTSSSHYFPLTYQLTALGSCAFLPTTFIKALIRWVSLSLYLNRFYAIKNPLELKNLTTQRHPRGTIFVTSSIHLLIWRLYFVLIFEIYLKALFVISVRALDILVSLEQFDYTDNMCMIRDYTNDKNIYVYIFFSEIVLPVIFNYVPAGFIVYLSYYLWIFLVKYEKSIASKKLCQLRHHYRMSPSRKSHVLTLIWIGIRHLASTLPYYLLSLFWSVYRLFINEEVNNIYLLLVAQGITSIFFNLNHCFNLLIYIVYHRDFKQTFFRFFRKKYVI